MRVQEASQHPGHSGDLGAHQEFVEQVGEAGESAGQGQQPLNIGLPAFEALGQGLDPAAILGIQGHVVELELKADLHDVEDLVGAHRFQGVVAEEIIEGCPWIPHLRKEGRCAGDEQKARGLLQNLAQPPLFLRHTLPGESRTAEEKAVQVLHGGDDQPVQGLGRLGQGIRCELQGSLIVTLMGQAIEGRTQETSGSGEAWVVGGLRATLRHGGFAGLQNADQQICRMGGDLLLR